MPRDEIATLEIGAAYLNADMVGQVYMKLDSKLTSQLVRMYPEYHPTLLKIKKLIMKLEKAFYGCIQLALLWYKCLKQTVISDSIPTLTMSAFLSDRLITTIVCGRFDDHVKL
jgi:hypothetical protein